MWIGSGCRALHVDWAPWADQEPAGHPGRAPGPPAAVTGPGHITPIPVSAGSQLLLNALATPGFPGRFAIHGRVGMPAPPALQAQVAAPRGRFLETIAVHYPGVELVADTRLTLASDPYLADYRIDGLPVLPLAMAVEAMAQAASALAGRPQLHLTNVWMPAPVVLPADSGRGEAVIRVSALRRGETIETVLRCGETSFRVDHARAVFHGNASMPTDPGASGLAPASTGPDSGPAATAPLAGGQDPPPGGIVDGTDLYGPVYFQTGRFRRVAFLPEVTSRSCRALVRGGDDQPWFGAVPGPVDAPLILGSPGLNDATSHVLQACVPHRRLLVAGCDALTVAGHEVRGAVQVRAVRRPRVAGGAWDVTATDATGQVIVAWAGLRLRAVGPRAGSAAWHPALLAAHLEGRAAELGLDPELRVAVCCDWAAPGAGREPWGDVADPGAPGAPSAGPGHVSGDPVPARSWTWSAMGSGSLDGLELRLRASRPVACHWEAAGSSVQGEEDSGPAGHTLADHDPRLASLGESAGDLLRLGRILLGRAGERAGTVSARLRAVAACLAASPWQPGGPLVIDDACDGGWVLVHAGTTVVACTVLGIAGVPGPVALSMATWPDGGPAVPAPHGAAGQSTSAAANGSAP